MTNLYILIGIVLALGVLFFVAAILFGASNEQEEELPYLKKTYLLTLNERKLFSILNEMFAEQYYVFPQIHIASILRMKSGEKHWQVYFNKIIKKSVDFVIFDKQNISPLLVIECDDITHEREDRIARDNFVNKALKAAGIPIMHVKTRELDYIDTLKKTLSRFDGQSIREDLGQITTPDIG